MKKWIFTAIYAVAFCFAMTACSSDNDDVETPLGKESELVGMTKTNPVVSMFSWNYMLRMSSIRNLNALEKPDKDYYEVYFTIGEDNNVGKWNGRYYIKNVEAKIYKVIDGRSYLKSELRKNKAFEDFVLDGTWADFTPLGKTDKEGYPMYDVTLHIKSMENKNGEYVNNINLTYSGAIEYGMLEY